MGHVVLKLQEALLGSRYLVFASKGCVCVSYVVLRVMTFIHNVGVLVDLLGDLGEAR